jgi:hypothetical protein
VLRELINAGNNPPLSNLLASYIGAWITYYRACILRIQEVLGKEDTQRILREVEQDRRTDGGC